MVGESSHGGTGKLRLYEMTCAGWMRPAQVAAHAQVDRGHDDPVSAQRAHRLLQPTPRILRTWLPDAEGQAVRMASLRRYVRAQFPDRCALAELEIWQPP